MSLHPLRVVSRQFVAWLEAKPKAEGRSISYLLRKLIQAEMVREVKAKKAKTAKS
ncbi:MAG TPA: hypothetical protein VFE60_11980 [Roseiarcus sp.]|nr:hypothetical protein [Roseiarcus sp.]